MRKLIKIGKLTFKTKKDTISYFKKILNSYNFGEQLNPNDFNEVFELLKKHHKSQEKIGKGIKEIRVEELRYKTKGFLIVRTDSTTEYFSYLKCINGRSNPLQKFSKTCREIVKDDINNVKLSYFKNNSKKGMVKCQETGELCKWTDLVVDHRQPNTFSVIVDRFIEVNNIKIETMEYIDTEIYGSKFKDVSLSEKFREYHKEKAVLRIVRKEKNLSRTHLARIGIQKKDLKIE